MGEIKISEMIEADSVNKDDLIMIVQNGLNKKVKAEKIGTGRNATGDTLPIGSIMPYPKTTSPENWLVCDGSAVSRTTYSELFNVIGEDFGAGDGSTTFNLPNIKGKTVVGLDTSDTDFNVIGKTIGEKTHKLTVEELAKHKHYVVGNYMGTSGDNHTPQFTQKSYDWLDTQNDINAYTGGDKPHNNLQPSIVQNYIIKAKQSSGVVATVVDNLDSTSSTDALSANQGKNLNDKITGTVLYENTKGTTENITLNDLIENYRYFEIESYVGFAGANVYNNTGKLPLASKTRIHINSIFVGAGGELQVYNKRVSISGNQLTVISDRCLNNSGMTEGSYTYITKIVGYEKI